MIKEATDIEATLIKGSGGIFDVKANGQLVYSKQASGNQFPDNQTVAESIKSLNL